MERFISLTGPGRISRENGKHCHICRESFFIFALFERRGVFPDAEHGRKAPGAVGVKDRLNGRKTIGMILKQVNMKMVLS